MPDYVTLGASFVAIVAALVGWRQGSMSFMFVAAALSVGVFGILLNSPLWELGPTMDTIASLGLSGSVLAMSVHIIRKGLGSRGTQT